MINMGITFMAYFFSNEITNMMLKHPWPSWAWNIIKVFVSNSAKMYIAVFLMGASSYQWLRSLSKIIYLSSQAEFAVPRISKEHKQYLVYLLGYLVSYNYFTFFISIFWLQKLADMPVNVTGFTDWEFFKNNK